MQNLTLKNAINSKSNNNFEIKKQFKIKDALKFYRGSGHSLIGLEYERITLDKNTLKVPDYEKVAKIIEHFASITGWELVYDEQTITGATDLKGNIISLEPGLQLELSLSPKKSIVEIETELTKTVNLIDKIGKLYDVIFLGIGMNPTQNESSIELLNKRRYKIMNNYLPNCKKGEFCPKMMRKTAGIQVNVDYKDKKDAYLKLMFLNMISPFMTALFASSPVENNHLTEYNSTRALSWLFTGQERCNIFYKNIFEHKFRRYENIFKNYVEELFKIPVLYIERNGEYIPFEKNITFFDFAKNGYKGYFATYEDFILHQSITFPDVRLKNYIEIRNHDSQSPAMALALCAFYKGLTECNMENIIKYFSYLKIDDIEKYSKEIIIHGLNIKIKDKTGWDIIAELFNFSRKKLNTMDRIYLEPVMEILKRRKTLADTIMDYNISSASELVEFLY